MDVGGVTPQLALHTHLMQPNVEFLEPVIILSQKNNKQSMRELFV